ncbi:MAG: taxilin, partial [Puniceicoccales bacterium]|nr:taxilin [Puniceicoccales bacterium]
ISKTKKLFKKFFCCHENSIHKSSPTLFNVRSVSTQNSEEPFFFYLVSHFPDSPKDVDNYLSLSGIDTDGKRAVLLLQAQKASLRGWSSDRHFSRYAKKIHFDPKEAEKLATENAKRLERETEALKKKCEQSMEPLLKESERLDREIEKEREEWLKANPRENSPEKNPFGIRRRYP